MPKHGQYVMEMVYFVFHVTNYCHLSIFYFYFANKVEIKKKLSSAQINLDKTFTL